MAAGIVALVVKPSFGVDERPPIAELSTAIPTTAGVSSRPVETPSANPDGPIEPGLYAIEWRTNEIQLTMPAGWGSTDGGTSIGKGLFMSVQVHDVERLVADVCRGTGWIDVGPTVDDLTTALEKQVGIRRAAPTDFTIGRFPARKVVLDLAYEDNDGCPGSDFRSVWANVASVPRTAGQPYPFSMIWGGTATVYVVDVNGERLVLTTHHRPISAEELAELDAMIASIEITPIAEAWLIGGRYALTVDGVPFSFTVPELVGYRGWLRYGLVYLSKDTVAGQSAEAAIYWTGLPDGAHTERCAKTLKTSADASLDEIATAVSTAPGTELAFGPADVELGGLTAKHVQLIVREAVGCDPGYFHSWVPAPGGPGWWSANPGDTIDVWIVDVDGKRFLIAGESTPEASPELRHEIQDIVASMQFE